ncbi:sugar transporter family protein [Hortaea werneckii]|nr:sugar transporter family protein [Hortaea werneckii]KAI7313342.1 sugar transporter family protein [Hortaea werneckii]
MKNEMRAGWFYSPSQIVRYALSRIPTLKPPRTKLKNPYTVLRQLNKHQWNMFAVGWAAWVWDSFDFFTVSLCITEIAEDFGVQNSEVSWGITVTLMLRSLGALIAGSFSDRYGRKWVMIANLFAFIVLELCTAFTQDLPSFLGVRALYGIAMGGLLGPAASSALEDLPYDARGILSGLFIQGYATGYLLGAIFYRALVPTTEPYPGWRSLFYFGAVPPVFIILWRWYLPETNYFQVLKAERETKEAEKAAAAEHGEKTSSLKAFLKDSAAAMKANWFLFVYMVVLMAGFNSISHGTQDFYPTFLKNQLGFGATQTTVVTVVGQIGALIGGTVGGYVSTFTGRRLAMMTSCVIGGALVPAYVLLKDMSLVASGFFEQFFVGAVWGPIPVHLIEMSPPALRSLIMGLTYQLGNLASSASATIQGVIEMTQEERNEEAEQAKEYERMREQGISLQEIGIARAKGVKATMEPGMSEPQEEKAAVELKENA